MESSSSKNSFVYVMHHATEDRIKIGHSGNPFARALALKLDKIDYSRSLQMAVEHGKVGATERMLHHLFSEYSVSVEHDGDGKTEWFEARALPEVRDFIERTPKQFPSSFVAFEVRNRLERSRRPVLGRTTRATLPAANRQSHPEPWVAKWVDNLLATNAAIVAEGADTSAFIDNHFRVVRSDSFGRWKTPVIDLVARAHGCRISRNGPELVIYGRTENANAAHNQFVAIETQTQNAACRALKARGMPTDNSTDPWCVSFYRGSAERLAEREQANILAHASEAAAVARKFPQVEVAYPQHNSFDPVVVEIGRREGA
jgi:hypothetical protein